MTYQKKIDELNNILGEAPEYLYHGRTARPLDKQSILDEITIYSNLKEIQGKPFWKLKGRTYLDCCFHGFYLTPCEALARKWALAKISADNEEYQILVFKTDQEAIKTLRGKINIVPDQEWAKHIYKNRARQVHENEYDFIFNFIADGTMAKIEPKINDRCYEKDFKAFHYDIVKDKYNIFLDDYYKKSLFTLREIVTSCDLTQYKNYQFCISSYQALNCIQLIDIIRIDKDVEVPDGLDIDKDLETYKKYVPYNILSKIMERSE